MMKFKRVTPNNLHTLTAPTDRITRMLITAGFELGYIIEIFPGKAVFRVTKGRKSIIIHGISSPLNNPTAMELANHKRFTTSILADAGIPVAHSVGLSRKHFKEGAWNTKGIQFPVVVKPLANTLSGEGVITNIRTKAALQKQLQSSFKEYRSMMIEEYYTGMEDYRVLVLDNKVIGALHRVRAYVVGDGKHSIKQLIATRNAERAAFEPIKRGLVQIDNEVHDVLKSQRYTIDSVPKAGKQVRLKNVCNSGAGGDVHDVTSQLHPQTKKMAIEAAKAIGLRLAGIDILCADISKPITRRNKNGIVIEVNYRPDLGLHEYPQQGKSRNVTKKVMEKIFD